MDPSSPWQYRFARLGVITAMLLTSLAVVAPPAQASASAPGFVRSIGGRGEADVYAWGIMYNPVSNQMLVGDYWNYLVRRYDMSGHELGAFFRPASVRQGQPYTLDVDPRNGDIWVTEISDGKLRGYVARYDMNGNYLGQILISAEYEAWTYMDASGHLFVADSHYWSSASDVPKIREYDLATCETLMATHPTQACQPMLAFGSYGKTPNTGQMGDVRGVGQDGAGNIYVADSTNLVVHVFSPTGTWLRDIGGAGSGLGQFVGDLRGLIIDKTNGWLYVVDAQSGRVEKFDLAGNALTQWGSIGTGPGQFGDGGRQLTLDASGNVWVADYGNFRFFEFDPNGALLATYPNPAAPPSPGGFAEARDVAVDSSGNVYVADSWNDRFQKFAPDGTFLGAWGARNSEPPYGMDYPRGIAVDPVTGNVWVADTRDHLIRVYDSNENYLFQVGNGTDSAATGSLRWPMDIEFCYSAACQSASPATTNGKVYIGDYNSGVIKILDASTGAELKSFSRSNNGIAVDPATGFIYVLSWSTDRVYFFDASGNQRKTSGSHGTQITFGSTGTGNGQFENPWDIDLVNGLFYITDSQLNRVQVFDLNGVYQGQWGTKGTGAYQLNNPSGISHDAAGNIYVADAGNDRIQVYNASTPITTGDTTAPTATLTTPLLNSTVPASPVTISGTMSDNVGVAKAEVSVRNNSTGLYWSAKDAQWVTAKTWSITPLAGTLTSPTFNFTFVGMGYSTQYQAQAKATDASGNTGLSANVRFTTQGPPTSDITPPTVTISAPPLDQSLPVGTVTISGLANDDLSGIATAQVAIRDRATNLWWNPDTSTWGTSLKWIATTLVTPGAVSTAWSYAWTGDVSGGSYFVQARATDNATNVSPSPYQFTRFTTT